MDEGWSDGDDPGGGGDPEWDEACRQMETGPVNALKLAGTPKMERVVTSRPIGTQGIPAPPLGTFRAANKSTTPDSRKRLASALPDWSGGSSERVEGDAPERRVFVARTPALQAGRHGKRRRSRSASPPPPAARGNSRWGRDPHSRAEQARAQEREAPGAALMACAALTPVSATGGVRATESGARGRCRARVGGGCARQHA